MGHNERIELGAEEVVEHLQRAALEVLLLVIVALRVGEESLCLECLAKNGNDLAVCVDFVLVLAVR